jgi:hypothetical protein
MRPNGSLFFWWREPGEFLPDHMRHPGPNTVELLKAIRIGSELVHGADVLAAQHFPSE